MISRGFRCALLISIGLLGARSSEAFDYAEWRSKAVAACEAIDPSDSQSGLFFNPDGYRSYYVRSKCFQETAVTFRDPALCEQVKQRRSLLSSSWGYTADRCRKLVAEAIGVDRKTLLAIKGRYANGGITLRDFRVERNGNGRDIDIVPAFAGAYAHGYTLMFEILPDAGSAVLLHTAGYHLDEQSNLRVYVPQTEVRQRFAGFTLGRLYSVRGTVVLDVGFGGPSGYWSPAFIQSVFPTRERSHAIVRQATF